MDETPAAGPNRSLIDDPTFIDYLDDLDRGLRARKDANEELPADDPPASSELPLQSPFNPVPGHMHPTARALADDPNFRASLDALDRGLSGERASPQPVAPTIVPRLRQQPPPPQTASEPLRVPAAWSSPEASADGGRPLLDLFPADALVETRAATPPAAQRRPNPLPPKVSEAPIDDLSDLSFDDLDDSSLPADLEDDADADGRSQPFKRLGFAVYLVVMMLVGASLSALVFHARVSRIIVQWQSVSTSVAPPAATPVNHD